MTPSVSIAGNLGCVHTVPYSFFAGTKISSHIRTVISARFQLNGEKLCLADLLSGESLKVIRYSVKPYCSGSSSLILGAQMR